MTNVDELMAIGALAEATGTTVSTLRYYDQLGLVPAAGRVGGKRRYHPESTGRVNFVRRAQQLGFSISEIGELLDDRSGTWKALVDSKVEQLVEHQASVQQMITLLEQIRSCGCQTISSCPRVDETALAGPE